jgi:hypothetical protein
MQWLRRFFRRDDVPAPAAGQHWRSGHSGRLMRVDRVRRTDWGGLIVSVAYEADGDDYPLPASSPMRDRLAMLQAKHAGAIRWTMAMDYQLPGLSQWRRWLRDEKRALVDVSELEG